MTKSGPSIRLNQAKLLSEALNRINVTLHSTLDFHEVAQRLLSEGSSALGSETASILRRKDAGWQISDVFRMPVSLVGTPMTAQEVQHAVLAIQSREVIAIDDALHDPRINREHVRQYNVRAVLAAPLIVRNNVIGVMFFNYHAGPHVFSEAEVHFAQQLATTAAIALDNARLFDEQLQAEQALRASEQRLHLALDAAAMGMWDWDLMTDTVLWNEQHFALFGVDPASFHNRADEAFAAIHPEDRARVQESMEQALARQGPFYTEFRVVHPDESVRWIASKGQRVQDAPNAPLRMIGICFDITERLQSEQAHEHYVRQEDIAQMHRLHMAGEFAALLAHQLNQPLSAIRSFAEAGLARLRHGIEEPERAQQTLTDIVTQSERAAQSIRDLRQFLARQPQELLASDVNSQVRAANSLMSILARCRKIRVSLDLSKSLPPALMRPSQIEQVIINLMENAIDAICHSAVADFKGGTIRVTTLLEAEKNEVIVTVQDNGPGLDAETAKRVFDPLFTTKKSGIGMGLTISRSIVEDHGGRIWAEAGAGGRFKFALPVAAT